jgi:hypothetical protein
VIADVSDDQLPGTRLRHQGFEPDADEGRDLRSHHAGVVRDRAVFRRQLQEGRTRPHAGHHAVGHLAKIEGTSALIRRQRRDQVAVGLQDRTNRGPRPGVAGVKFNGLAIVIERADLIVGPLLDNRQLAVQKRGVR